MAKPTTSDQDQLYSFWDFFNSIEKEMKDLIMKVRNMSSFQLRLDSKVPEGEKYLFRLFTWETSEPKKLQYEIAKHLNFYAKVKSAIEQVLSGDRETEKVVNQILEKLTLMLGKSKFEVIGSNSSVLVSMHRDFIEKHQVLEFKIKEVRIISLKQEKQRIQDENDKLREQNQTIRNENEKLRQQNQTIRGENQNLMEDIKKIRTENKDIRREMQELEKEKEILNQEIKQLQDQNDKLKQQMKVLWNENEKLKREMKEMQEENQKKFDKLETQQKEGNENLIELTKKVNRLMVANDLHVIRQQELLQENQQLMAAVEGLERRGAS